MEMFPLFFGGLTAVGIILVTGGLAWSYSRRAEECEEEKEVLKKKIADLEELTERLEYLKSQNFRLKEELEELEEINQELEWELEQEKKRRREEQKRLVQCKEGGGKLVEKPEQQPAPRKPDVQVEVAKVELAEVPHLAAILRRIEESVSRLDQKFDVFEQSYYTDGGWGGEVLRWILEESGLQRFIRTKKGEEASTTTLMLDFHNLRLIIETGFPPEVLLKKAGHYNVNFKEQRAKFLKWVRDQIKELGERYNNWKGLGVILFLPTEGLFKLAVEEGVWEEGVRNRIYIASPTTLVPMLRLVYMIVRSYNFSLQHRKKWEFLASVEEWAQQVLEEGEELRRQGWDSIERAERMEQKAQRVLMQLNWFVDGGESDQLAPPTGTPPRPTNPPTPGGEARNPGTPGKGPTSGGSGGATQLPKTPNRGASQVEKGEKGESEKGEGERGG